MNNKKSIMPWNGSIAPIEQQTIDRIISDAEDARLFAKPTDTGEFQIGDEYHPRIIGRVVEIDRFAGKWDGGEMEKKRDFDSPESLPEGWELRADITVLTPDFQYVTINLPPSSYKFHFANQVKRMERVGRNVTDLVAEFTVKTVKGKRGTFAVVITKFAEPSGGPLNVTPEVEKGPSDITDDQIPF